MSIIFKKTNLSIGEYRSFLERAKKPGRVMKLQNENKYKNESCSCVAGHKHDSSAEARYCETLYYLKKAGEIKDYEIQKKFSMDIGRHHICNHYVDFFVEENSGEKIAEEYKGVETSTWAIKRKLFEALYPDIKYIVVRKNKRA